MNADEINSDQHYEENETYHVTVQTTYEVQAPDGGRAKEAILRILRKAETVESTQAISVVEA